MKMIHQKKNRGHRMLNVPDLLSQIANFGYSVHSFLLFRSRQENRFPIPPPKKPKISLYTYTDVFNREFNLSFGLLQTDTCARCEALDMA